MTRNPATGFINLVREYPYTFGVILVMVLYCAVVTAWKAFA